MAKAGEVRIRIDNSRMRATVGHITYAAVARGAEVARGRYIQNISNADLVNTGKMISSVRTEDVPGSSDLHPRKAIGTPVPYAKFQEYGTRAHGPVRAKFLRFKPKGAQGFVFAKWVRGVKPQRFAQRALDSIRPTDFE